MSKQQYYQQQVGDGTANISKSRNGNLKMLINDKSVNKKRWDNLATKTTLKKINNKRLASKQINKRL